MIGPILFENGNLYKNVCGNMDSQIDSRARVLEIEFINFRIYFPVASTYYP